MVPITSKRGREQIYKNGIGLCTNKSNNNDSLCQPPTRYSLKESKKTWPASISKKMKFKKNDHVHEYSFNKYERIKKINEAVIGKS